MEQIKGQTRHPIPKPYSSTLVQKNLKKESMNDNKLAGKSCEMCIVI